MNSYLILQREPGTHLNVVPVESISLIEDEAYLFSCKYIESEKGTVTKLVSHFAYSPLW